MTWTQEDSFAESAERMAKLQPVMVAELTETPDSARTVWVAAARIDGVEGIVHIVETGRKRKRYFAKFTSDDEIRDRWGR